MSAAYLAHHFATKFPLYLNSKFATVEWGSRNFEGKPTMEFHGFKWLPARTWRHPTMTGSHEMVRSDYRVHGADLQRQSVDAVDDTTAYYLERTVGWPSKVGADQPSTSIARISSRDDGPGAFLRDACSV